MHVPNSLPVLQTGSTLPAAGSLWGYKILWAMMIMTLIRRARRIVTSGIILLFCFCEGYNITFSDFDRIGKPRLLNLCFCCVFSWDRL